MATFYAKYPSTSVAVSGTSNVQGLGTAGTPTGGVLTIQGDPAGTPIPISGSISATNPSVSATGAADPASATYIGMNVAGTLTGVPGTANGVKVDGSAVTQPVSGTVAVSNFPATQPVSGTVAATQSGTWNIGTVTTVTGVTTVSTVSAVTAITNALPAGTNNIGKISIDQATPGTTNGVVVNTVAPVTTTTAAFQAEGATAFGSITNSFVTIFTPTAATKILQMRNNTNAAISVSMDAGSTTNYTLDSGDFVSLDLLSNALSMGATAIQIKYAVGAPTSGSFRVNGVH